MPACRVCYRVAMKLIAFDGDDTLWTPLSGVNLSDRTATDAVGWPHFTYMPLPDDPLTARRDDGALFALCPEAAEVFRELRDRAVLVGVISYNHEENIRSILEAFALLAEVDYIVAEWHSNKDKMLGKMLAQARVDGHSMEPGDLILVDDDPWEIYRGQCARMGAGFSRFGVDILDLRDVLAMDNPSPPI
ncbi:MAG: HAD-IIIC family phosphatase [Chloroflexia bacterium]